MARDELRELQALMFDARRVEVDASKRPVPAERTAKPRRAAKAGAR